MGRFSGKLILILALLFSLLILVPASVAESCDEGEEIEEIPGSNIEAIYQVAGTIQQGSFVSDVDVRSSLYGNVTGSSVYTSKLVGKGSVQFASSTHATGDTVLGELAVMLGDGRVFGKASGFNNQMNPGEPEEPEELGEGIIPVCIFDEEEPEEMGWVYPPFCEDVTSVNQFDITSGQAGIISSVSMPVPSSVISQSLAVQGNGWAKSSGGYLYYDGENATISNMKNSNAFTVIRGHGITFASQFNYTAIRG